MSGPADFLELVDAAMPWEDGTILMLRAYFDASQRDSGVFSVAGVAFGVDRAKKADREWRSAFDGRRLHMADLHARKGEFDGITAEDAGRYCKAAVQIINRYASVVVAVSCDVDEVERLRPKGPEFDSHQIIDSARSSYNCGLHWTMMALGGILGDGQRVQYWFERGDRFQGASRRFLETLNNPDYERLRHAYCYGSDAFVDKADAPLFDAADLVAWEWGKHIDRVRAEQPVRPSLIALMGDQCVVDGKPGYRSDVRGRGAIHASGEPLARFFRKLSALILARSHEEVDAVLRMD
ncbi:MAG: hypothetical protein BroJett026_20430 [Betaproteobacteria bacterium]|nr:MAG: hypothetical protein BroJett026_20430 [Betaproteobacteria bacterium]